MALSATAFLEKNKLASAGNWLVLLKLTLVDDSIIRICRNSEDAIWPVTDGDTWTAFPFELDEIGDSSKGEVPQFTVKIANASRAMQAYNEAYSGLVDSDVQIQVVHSTNVTTATLGAGVNNPDPEIDLYYKIVASHSDNLWASYTLGATNPYKMRFPRGRVMKHFCRYKDFKGDRCQYDGADTSCDRTMATCRLKINLDALSNIKNFGGAPGVGSTGIYV